MRKETTSSCFSRSQDVAPSSYVSPYGYMKDVKILPHAKVDEKEEGLY